MPKSNYFFPMTDEDDTASKTDSLNVLLGLLDFNSDSATTHASFVVASIFGIYAVLFRLITTLIVTYVGKLFSC